LINGGKGNDVLIGGVGEDRLDYSGIGIAAGVTISLAIATAQDTGGAGVDKVSGFENLTGSAFDDKLTGDANANSIAGDTGEDVIEGGAGNDALDGGLGFD